MKKWLVFLLSIALLCTLVTACGGSSAAPTTQATEQTEATIESPEEAEVLKIMILGSSRSVNTFQMLYEVFKDQMPDQKVELGIMYYSGCSMSMHANFIKENASVYRYYYNNSGMWDITENVNMDAGLQAQNWDVILLQAGTGDLKNNVNEPDRIFLQDYVNKLVKHPHVFWWHSTWFNSTDPTLYAGAKTSLNPNDIDQYKQLTSNHEAVAQHIQTGTMFAGHISSGTPMMYALKILEVPEVDLYRDHTHLTDFGCLLVGYSWYTQFTGNPVTEINLDTIPVYLRHTKYQHLGDMEVTEQMKQIIIQTADYTLNNPWAIPRKD